MTENNETEKEWTINEIIEKKLLPQKRRMIFYLIKKGKLRAIKYRNSHKTTIPQSAIDEFLKSNKE